ncbi:MAG TPA: ABC transporter permease, partial [Firmicutes bacterium]|nr:ABC transporter permease [Bacillota bacterium]
NGMATQNNISEEYISYLENMNSEWYAELMYSYGAAISDNLFLQAETFPDGNNKETELTTRSLSNLKNKYITDLMAFASQYDSLIGYADYFLDVVNVMPGTSDDTNLGYGEYVLSQYDVIAGHFPQNENEVVLVVGANNQVTDLTLAQLGLLEEDRFMDLFNLGTDDSESVTDPDADRVNFADILGKKYTFFYNDEVYTENEGWTPVSYLSGQYAFTYQGQRDNADFTAAEGEGLNLKISGILRLKDGLSYGCLSAGLNLTENTVKAYIEGNLDSQIVQWMNEDAKYPLPSGTDLYLLPVATENLTSGYTLYEVLPGTSVYIAQTPDAAIKTLGGSRDVSRISIYATDFDSKENILAYLDQWNADHDGSEEERTQQITYTDTVGLLMGMVQQILDIITYVLVAFTAISLVVSSVMIGIITYVSVVERVKEIGVLRSLGARKQDVRNLFNAETFIIGLGAGLIGIGLSYFISIFINIAIQSLTGITGIAALPFTTALIMVLVSVVLTLISGLIPAQSAAKKDPVIALRTE